MCFSSELSRYTEKGDYDKYSHTEEVVINDIDNFNRRLISSVLVTEESALKTSIQQRKRRREVSAAAININAVQVLSKRSSEKGK